MEWRRANLRRTGILYFVDFFITFLLASSSLAATPANTLDAVIRDYAVRAASARPRTGILIRVPLPANLSGVEASVVRLRTGTVWVRGANFSTFHIAPRTAVTPYARRFLVVYQNLGNQSSAYDHPSSGYYVLASPVVVILAYESVANKTDSTNPPEELQLLPMGEPISVLFNGTYGPDARCALLAPNGSVVTLGHPEQGTCLVSSKGHFAIVEPTASLPPSPAAAKTPAPAGHAKEWRWMWAVAGGGVAVGLAVATVIVIATVGWIRRKKMVNMIKKAEDEVVLESAWVRGSKMPVAGAVRTKPVLETGEARWA